ncbi:MAG: FtsW/RodA/SpoVE family cell cycle protein [Candidatus Promineofilum sp.]|nr:FtsW/RodA/SpoVE family cell cycle protein [Promineifilum sp.]
MIRLNSGLSAWRRSVGQSFDDRERARDNRELALILAAVVFVFLNAVAFSLVTTSAPSWPHLYAPLIWAVTVVGVHLALRVARPRRDPFLLPIFALLAGWGLLLQDRLAPNFLGRQTLWFVLAAIALLFVAILPRTLQPLMRYRYTLLMGGLLLLAITLIFGVNPSGQGAALWLPIPFPVLGTVYFQPSELLKLLLVVFLASYFTELDPLYHYRKEAAGGRNGHAPNRSLSAFRRHLPFLGPLLLMWGFTLLLLVWQKDLGAAALFFIVFVILLYLATGEKVYTLSGIALLLLAGVIAFFAFDTVVAPRVLSWLNPWPNVSDRAYQIVQALYAQAAGGVFGQGIGQGHPDFIPVVHSDFALAAISEEWGLIGSLSVVGCFAVLALRGLRAATRSIQGNRPQYFHAYVAAGVVTLLCVQTFLIMGGVTRLLPLTGITLPFVSYGGSSMLVSSLAIGLLLYISADAEAVSPGRSAEPGLARRIERLGIAILLTFAIVALTLTYWSVIRADSLLAREDNPRLIEAERRVHRGRIVDRHGTVLAETTGPADGLFRVYPLAESGPAVGYYSLRFGSAGIEEAYDAHLRGRSESFWGDALRRLFHAPFTGADVRLTLDAGLQREATQLMSQAGTTGSLVLLEIVTVDGGPVADIRAMVSNPGYDPNRIDNEFETLSATEPGPLFNRATQGLYQPGLVVQPLIMAAAVDDELLDLEETPIDPFAPVTLHGQELRCEQTPEIGEARAPTWREMGRWR